jgi:septum formation protein
MPDFIYLASQSPRRRQLLEQLGVRYELLLPDSDEDAEALEAVLKNEAPAAYVQRVTGLKLDAAVARMKRRKLPPAPILCSDTTWQWAASFTASRKTRKMRPACCANCQAARTGC